jgi:hypothetical protein
MKTSGSMQSFFSFMAKNHHFIEDMFRLGLKSEWIISESELYNLMRSNDKEPEYNKKFILERLVEFGVLTEFQGDLYEVQPQFSSFLQWLLRERKMYDHGYLVSSIEKMQRSQNSIEENYSPAPDKRQLSKITIRADLKQIIDAMNDLSLFVRTNRDSIILATKTVSDDEKYESKLTRYLEVKRLYDEYVEPSKKMIQQPFANTCDSIIRTLEETEIIFVEDEYIANLANIIKIKMISLRQLLASAHHDMWNDLTIALKELSTFVELHHGALLGQKIILQKGAKGLNEIIENELRIVSFNPRNLFTDLGLEVYLSNLANAEYIIPEFEIPEIVGNPDQPIQTQVIEKDLMESKFVEDLLLYIISKNPSNSLEQCFISAIEIAEKFKQKTRLTDNRSIYKIDGVSLDFNSILWEVEA